MTTESRMLLYSLILGLAHIFVGAAFSTKERGLKWNMSSREGSSPPLSGAAGRLERASKNFFETFPLFAVAVLLLTQTQSGNAVSGIGAQAYFFGRLVYLPIYGLGVTGIRSLVWTVSVVGLLMVLAPLFGL